MERITMKKLFIFLLTVGLTLSASAQNYTDVLDLTLFGKVFETSHPFDRIDPLPGMTDGERNQAKQSSGLAVAFSTNSKSIGVRVVYRGSGSIGGNSATIAARGFDLYMKTKDARWMWAGNGFPKKFDADVPHEVQLIQDSGTNEKACILYLPLTSRIASLEVITDEGAWIESSPAPFKGRIAVFGSSFTQGSGAGRCAMTWEAQLSRATGLNFMNFGFSGNCKLQPYFADALCGAHVDAYVFDAFSNPTPAEVRERLEPFIQKLTKARPGVPLIFLQTIRREKRNFSSSYDAKEYAKRVNAEKLMKEMTEKYPDVYWVNTTNATSSRNEATSDGTHPDSYGYTLWMESVKEPIIEILRKYEKN